jgi:hypothetical protein
MAGYIAFATESAILQLVFQAAAWANYADNAAASPQTNIAIALHTADPLGSGTASSSEVAYTSYTRVNVARTSGGWSVSGNGPATASPVANISFPAGTGGSGTVTNFSTSKSNASPPTGAQTLLWAGIVTPSLTTGTGITPILTTATAITLL